MVPGKKMELNEGIRLLMGKPKIDIPLKKKEEPEMEKAAPAAPAITGKAVTKCTVEEGGVSRVFTVTVEPITSAEAVPAASAPAPEVSAPAPSGTSVHSTFAGSVEVSEILVKVGDKIKKGQVVAKVEAMKAQHDIVAPCEGTVSAIHVELGDEVDSTKPILTIS
jgi:pyruvate carboxylase subunit B